MNGARPAASMTSLAVLGTTKPAAAVFGRRLIDERPAQAVGVFLAVGGLIDGRRCGDYVA
jgi:hypothetical protein